MLLLICVQYIDSYGASNNLVTLMSILREVLLNRRVVGQLQFRNGCKSKILLNTSKLASCSGNFVQPRPVKFSKGSKNLHQYFSFYPLWLEPPPYFRFRNGFDSTRKGFELGNVFFYSGIQDKIMFLPRCLLSHDGNKISWDFILWN